MTIQEFDNFSWTGNTFVLYHDRYEVKKYEVASVNFQEKLIGLLDDENINWVRCENVEIINQ